MSNKKLPHLLQLVQLCERIQARLLSRGRSMQHDFIVVNLYTLVTQYPWITQAQFMRCYQLLSDIPWTTDRRTLDLGRKIQFTVKSLLHTV